MISKALSYGLMALLCLGLMSTKALASNQDETIVVSATRTEVSLQDAPGAITVITAADIAATPARDLVDILSSTPGISLAGSGIGGRKSISIRGAEARHTLILIDGRRIAASNAVMGHANYENSWIPLEDIERVEVVRGPLSALYGSEALGGVVNIITKKTADRWRGNIKLGGGVTAGDGGDNTNIGATISGPLVADRVGLSIAIESVRDKAIEDKDNPPFTEIEGRKILTFAPRVTITPFDDHRFELFASLSDEERDLVGSSRGTIRDSVYELKKYTYGLGWSGTTGPAYSKINLYRSVIDKETINTPRNGSAQTFVPDIATNEVIDAQTSFSLLGQLVTLGGEYRDESIESHTLTAVGGKETITHQAAFAQVEVGLFGDRLLLTPGIRYDHHEFFGSEYSPRIYALYKLTDEINLKAGYGQAFMAPTGKQLSPGYFFAAGGGFYQILGNPDVKPETSDTYEVGIEYFDETVTAKAFYYYSDIEDLIEYRLFNTISSPPSPPTTQHKASNVDKARIQGIETELSVNLPYDLRVSGNYNWLDAEDQNTNKPLNGRPEHRLGARLKHQFTPWGLSSVLRYEYIGKQYFLTGRGPNTVQVEAPGYSLWHASVEKFLTDNISIQAGVDNIGDVRLRDKADVFPYDERGQFFYAALRGNF